MNVDTAVTGDTPPPPQNVPPSIRRGPDLTWTKMTSEEVDAKVKEVIMLSHTHKNDNDATKKINQLCRELNRAKKGEEAVPGLVELLQDKNIEIRIRAAGTLWELNVQAQKAIPALLDALKDMDWRIRQAAIRTLGQICMPNITMPQPPETADVVKALIPYLQEPIGEGTSQNRNMVSLYTLHALGYIGPAAQEAIPSIIPMLKHEHPSVRNNALFAVSEIGGPEAVKAIPTIEQMAKSDPSAEVVRNAGPALYKLRKPKP